MIRLANEKKFLPLGGELGKGLYTEFLTLLRFRGPARPRSLETGLGPSQVSDPSVT